MMTVTVDLTVEQARELLEVSPTTLAKRLMKRLMANQLEHMAQRVAGPTTIEFSPGGIQVTAAGSSRHIPWSSVRWVTEGANKWSVLLAPSGLHVIPDSAVPAAQRHEFS